MVNELNRMIAEELAQRFPRGSHFIVVGYGKLGGPETTEFRRTLRKNKIHMEVVKNSIAVRALEANGLSAGAKFLNGPCALVVGDVEMPALCKVLTEAAKKVDNRIFIRGGVMGDVALEPAGIVQLASIPPLPVLHATLVGSIQAPISRVAGAFQSILRSLASALDGIRKKKESSAPPATPPPAASEPAPSPAPAPALSGGSA